MTLEAPSAEFKITSANRQAVKDWLAAQGFDATRVQSMRDQTLLKAYTDPRYLRALTNRGDYNPAASRSEGDCPQGLSVERNGNGEALSVRGDRGKTAARIDDKKPERGGQGQNGDGRDPNLPERPLGVPLNSMAEAGLSSAPAVPKHTQPLTEARVIELIRALAVLKPGLDGLEDLL